MNRTVWCLMLGGALMTGCGGQADQNKAASEQAAEKNHVHSEHEGEEHDGHDHEAEGHDHEAELAAEAAHADEIVFPKAQAERAGLKVERVEPGVFCEVIRTSGQVLAAQGDEVSLSAPVSGIVSFAGPRLTEGAQVVHGARLFYISSRKIATGDINARTKAAYDKARADYERAKELLADRIVSQREYDQTKLAYEQALAEYEAIASIRSERGTVVAAPIPGFLTSLSVKEGDYVEMGAPLATVSKNRRLMLRAEVSQKYYDRLKSVRSANFKAPYEERVWSLKDMNGRLVSVGKASPSGSYLIPVTFEFDNRGGVVPGSFVEVWLTGAPQSGVISVPLSAVTEQQGVYYVYVRLDEEGYQRREVKLGPGDGERVRILSGLAPGEEVVTEGAVHVRMASASASIPGHTHNH
ncbi:efflux RND transporter periplasmic adaptor subunit [Gallalistipes aquisgranensis]|uniref:efflux RND transporter periplasmic adaptor subunit n=1 Tax=Gallalistipes aquisgranensis TaxID=2779358 RepID=UPI001CF8D271|nr:efflux RND transporter periplasmic adaptor subunit [Gallalistipes aquisgranensis]MBE5032499.1 efflux RND transporter periplasmic adaptor subunit [Gallalistipes aquisgranensis]